MRRLAVLTLTLLVFALVGAPAHAQTEAGGVLDAAADALRRDPVYIHPDAELKPTNEEADRIRRVIREGDRAVFVAVMPSSVLDEVDGDANKVPQALYLELGYAGTYATVAGRSFRAGSTDLGAGRAGTLATKSFQDHRDDGIGAVLLAFVEDVEGGDGGGFNVVGAGLLVGLVALVVYLVVRGRRKRAAERRVLESARQRVKGGLAVLSDDVLSLEPVVALHPDARDEYEEAITRHRFASESVDRVQTRDDLERVERVVAEGNYAMARARAVIDGREPPPPPPELAAPGRHAEPPVVVEDGRPTYGGGFGGGWYGGGGWFGGPGGLLTGILIGDMLSDHGGGPGGHDGGFDAGVGGGDFGGGGGDFGGGGDVGGGDF